MLKIINTEFQKIKRYHILLIGIIGMVCSPLLQLFSQSVLIEEAQNPHFNMAALIESTIWGNATIFLPVIITLIGGYLINREYTDDTLKNVLTVPISFRRFLVGKSAVIGLLSIILGVYGFVITIIIGICAGLSGISGPVLLKGILQMTGISVCVYIVVLPLIAVCGKKPGTFMLASIIAFILGYCCMFFKNGLLRDIYPFSASLTLIGFDMASYAGTAGTGSVPLAIAALGIMLLISALIICISKTPGTAKNPRPTFSRTRRLHGDAAKPVVGGTKPGRGRRDA